MEQTNYCIHTAIGLLHLLTARKTEFLIYPWSQAIRSFMIKKPDKKTTALFSIQLFVKKIDE